MNILMIQKRRLLNFLIFLTLGMFVVILVQTNLVPSRIYYYFYPKEGIHCYRIKTHSLPDITEIRPRKGKSIFFHETSCNSYGNGKISITSRQACAVESAAKMNPNFDIYLLYASPGTLRFEGSESDRVLKALLTYKNVNILHLDYEKYTHNTPVETLYKMGTLDKSEYAQSHSSDVLRYLTLWKYGGIYLDLDVIVTKSLEQLPLNFAGSESQKNVAAGVLSFAPYDLGHNLAKSCLDDLKDHFNGHEWGYNGPGVITRLLKSICGVEQALDMINKDCQGFTVYPTDKFYAVPWWNWTMYFEENFTEEVLNVSRNSYAIHVWNKHSVGSKIPLISEAPYLLYAKKYCPKVIEQCDEFF